MSDIVILPTVVTYDNVIAEGSGPADIAANVRARNVFGAPFVVNELDQATLTTDPEQNFTAQEVAEMVSLPSLRVAAWALSRPLPATVYGQPRVVEYVALARFTDAEGQTTWSSTMSFQGGCIVGTGPHADELAASRRA